MWCKSPCGGMATRFVTVALNAKKIKILEHSTNLDLSLSLHSLPYMNNDTMLFIYLFKFSYNFLLYVISLVQYFEVNRKVYFATP